jgi:DNA-directed RNA polymerase specialized sigma24 family protein
MCFQDALATTGGMKQAEVNDQSVAMQLAMNLLKPKECDILRLVYLQNHDLAQAAESLGITKDAANMRLVRARQSLATKLAGWSELIG